MSEVATGKSQTSAYCIDLAIARSIQSRLLSCLLHGLLYELKKKKIIRMEVINLHPAMQRLPIIHSSSQTQGKTQYTVVSEIHHWKTDIMIVTTSKRRF